MGLFSFGRKSKRKEEIKDIQRNEGIPFGTDLPEKRNKLTLIRSFQDVTCIIEGSTEGLIEGAIIYFRRNGQICNCIRQHIGTIENEDMVGIINSYLDCMENEGNYSITAKLLSIDEKIHIIIGIYGEKNDTSEVAYGRISIGRKKDYSHNKEQVYNNREDMYAPTWGEIKNQEEAICRFFIEHVDKDESSFSIEHKSEDYTTLVFQKHDVVRVKYTPDSKWISVNLSQDDRKMHIDDERFIMQKNKNQIHWKSRDLENLDEYVPLVEHKCSEAEHFNSFELDSLSHGIYEKLKLMMVECGADDNYIRYSYTKAKTRVLYISWNHVVSFRTFKRKPHQVLLDEKLGKNNKGIFSEKKDGCWVYEFRTVDELNELMPYIKAFVEDTHNDDNEWYIQHWDELD